MSTTATLVKQLRANLEESTGFSKAVSKIVELNARLKAFQDELSKHIGKYVEDVCAGELKIIIANSYGGHDTKSCSDIVLQSESIIDLVNFLSDPNSKGSSEHQLCRNSGLLGSKSSQLYIYTRANFEQPFISPHVRPQTPEFNDIKEAIVELLEARIRLVEANKALNKLEENLAEPTSQIGSDLWQRQIRIQHPDLALRHRN